MRQHFTLILILLLSWGLKAQNNMGFHTDNYSGVYSLSFNPAEIVDSRYKFHFNVFSLSQTASNNYLGMRREALFGPGSDTAFADPNFDDNYVVERLNGRRKSVYQNMDIGLLPSFMFSFGKKTQRSIAFNARVRTNVNAEGIDERTARQAFREMSIVELYDVGIQNKNFSLQAASWAEFGLSYGQDIINTGKHYLKAAGTMKLTQGLASAYFYSDNADIVFTSDSTMTVKDTDIKFGYSEAFSNLPRNFKEATDRNRYGLAWDIGAVYEFRPKHEEHKYELDGDPDFMNITQNKYMFKVGFSITDIGFLNFQRARGLDAEFYANVNDIVLERFFAQAFDNFGSTGLQGFNDTLILLFDEGRTKSEYYLMPLPTRINLYFDYHIWKGFYANFTASLSPGYIRDPQKTRAISEFSLTPRFENSWFGFYLPTSINMHGNFHLGAGMRIGPLVVGTYDITPLLGKKVMYDANFYMALSVPIAKSLKDKDKDHVSKKYDECKKQKGTWATKGCPDSDGDGIADSEDKCPDVAGLPQFNGCPDRDGDGIIDSEDKCPDDAGLAQFDGCPDSDGDGIIDSEDKCPDVAGLPEFSGCPDTDGDGVPDPDDACPGEKGPKENKGCPWPDTDGDGVLDKDDACPNVPGTIANKGCPEIKEEVKKIIQMAFDKLEFETGKAVIKSVSLPSLDKLVKVMAENPEFSLRIAGHTDNVGNPDANMKLSRDRAEAVKAYFVKKGINANRFTVEAYGDTKPIADNKRSEGRKKNRRVEMEITVEKVVTED